MKKTIYIYSPSSAVRDRSAFRRGVARLKALGHEVEIDEAALATHMRFAGDDDIRLAAIHRAASSGADMALISRGGYGITRLLDGIHYKAVARAIEKGIQFVGISDFTAFQNAVLARTGAVTWAGPALGEGFGVARAAEVENSGPDEIMEACFDDVIHGQGEGAGWRQHKDAASQTDYVIKNAILWGGNLSVLCGLLGSPYFPDIKGGLLFLEDVHEHPYRIERMLSQLLYAGVLGRQKAIILGQFTDYKSFPHDKGYRLETVVDWLRQKIKTPVLNNLPYGHVATKVMLPVGAQTSLMVNGRDALLYWG